MALLTGVPATAANFNAAFASKTDAEVISGGKSFANYIGTNKLDVATSATITALSSSKTFIKLTGSTTTSIQGITAGLDGQHIIVYNASTAVVTFNHQNSGASASNRIKLYGGLSITINEDQSVELFYDITQSRWLVKSSTRTVTAAGVGLLNAKFDLEGSVIPYTTFGGVHYQTGTQSLTIVNISMLNSGTSGSTSVRINQYRSGTLFNSATASLSASSGNPSGTAASLSGTLSLLVGDIITADIVSVANGIPESLTVEY